MLRSFEPRRTFGCTSRTVSYARELISVSICYSQGDGLDTSLSRFMYCTHASRLLPSSCVVYGVVYCVECSCRWHGHVLPGTTVTTIMCVHQLYHQGYTARPHLRPSRIYPEGRAYQTRGTLGPRGLGGVTLYLKSVRGRLCHRPGHRRQEYHEDRRIRELGV